MREDEASVEEEAFIACNIFSYFDTSLSQSSHPTSCHLRKRISAADDNAWNPGRQDLVNAWWSLSEVRAGLKSHV
jgi:hypothetical protein